MKEQEKQEVICKNIEDARMITSNIQHQSKMKDEQRYFFVHSVP